MLFVDSHVHLYPCFDIEELLDSALENFQKAAEQYNDKGDPAAYVLLLTERRNEEWFKQIALKLAMPEQKSITISENWQALQSEEQDSLLLRRNNLPETTLYLVAGRQIVTKEKIEVLALYTQQSINDGLLLTHTVDEIIQGNGIPVLPWGVGKWLGKRGKRIQECIINNDDTLLYVGDNGGRPRCWSTPALFTMAAEHNIALLPGTDALPLNSETGRAGSFGFYLRDSMADVTEPTVYLKNMLLSQKAEIIPFGRLQKNSLFLSNQFRLRFSH